ncbi:hypothetical protein P8452_11411 [Trifolium repens]|nr:hypothetical protein P8452_11411 [Trifolium repens]
MFTIFSKTPGTPGTTIVGNVGRVGSVTGKSTLETSCIFRRLRAPSTFVIDENDMSRSGTMNDQKLMEAIFLS